MCETWAGARLHESPLQPRSIQAYPANWNILHASGSIGLSVQDICENAGAVKHGGQRVRSVYYIEKVTHGSELSAEIGPPLIMFGLSLSAGFVTSGMDFINSSVYQSKTIPCGNSKTSAPGSLSLPSFGMHSSHTSHLAGYADAILYNRHAIVSMHKGCIQEIDCYTISIPCSLLASRMNLQQRCMHAQFAKVKN